LWGKGQKAYDKGRFNTDWGCHSPQEIEILYNALREKLNSSPPFDAFDSLTLLIGERNARIFCRESRHAYQVRPEIVPTVMRGVQRMRMNDHSPGQV
jgi:hypothetical protein